MRDTTIGTIYAIKSKNIDYDDAAKDFWSKYSGCDPEWYGEVIMMDIATNTFCDFIRTADNPGYELYQLFDNMRFDCKTLNDTKESFDKRIRNAIWTTLSMTDVKDRNGNFVNGFRDLVSDK